MVLWGIHRSEKSTEASGKTLVVGQFSRLLRQGLPNRACLEQTIGSKAAAAARPGKAALP